MWNAKLSKRQLVFHRKIPLKFEWTHFSKVNKENRHVQNFRQVLVIHSIFPHLCKFRLIPAGISQEISPTYFTWNFPHFQRWYWYSKIQRFWYFRLIRNFERAITEIDFNTTKGSGWFLRKIIKILQTTIHQNSLDVGHLLILQYWKEKDKVWWQKYIISQILLLFTFIEKRDF